MPELPEVETVRRDLKSCVLGKKIVRVEVRKGKLVQGVSVRKFKKYLEGKSFSEIGRRGKLLVFRFKGSVEKTLLVHLKMTGQLVYKSSKGLVVGGHRTKKLGKLPGKYSHIILDFEDGSRLFFNDLRQFGYWKLVEKKELGRILNGFGMEPLTDSFRWKDFEKLVRSKKRQIKAFLLDQKMVAGIGNIYADEICFKVRIRPNRKLSEISEKKIKILYREITNVLSSAIKKKGTSYGSYLKFLRVYGREGKKCLVCKKGRIKKINVAGRKSRYCPICQI